MTSRPAPAPAPDRFAIEPSRARAYGRIVKLLREIGPAQLHPAEIEVVRSAADALLFSHGAADAEARSALDDAHALARRLVSSGRWTSERATHLLQDIRACGPAEWVVRDEAAQP